MGVRAGQRLQLGRSIAINWSGTFPLLSAGYDHPTAGRQRQLRRGLDSSQSRGHIVASQNGCTQQKSTFSRQEARLPQITRPSFIFKERHTLLQRHAAQIFGGVCRAQARASRRSV